MLWRTKDDVSLLIADIIRLKKRLTVDQKQTSRRGADIRNREDVVMIVFEKLSRLVELCDRQFLIRRNELHQRALVVSCQAFSQFFDENVSRLSADYHESGPAKCLLTGETPIQFQLPVHMMSGELRQRNLARDRLRESADDQRKQRAALRRTSQLDIDIHDMELEEKVWSIEEAVILIQKFERVYQAISRRNYLQHVYQKAMDIHMETGCKLDETHAAILIQARTRGYFARKRANAVRSRELNLLGMTMESLLRAETSYRNGAVMAEDTFERIGPIQSLSALLDELLSNFYYVIEDKEVAGPPRKKSTVIDDIYQELYLRGVVRVGQTGRLRELVSYRVPVKLDGRSFSFDLRSFICATFAIPIGLRSWHLPFRRRWLLLVGSERAGKSHWTEAVCQQTGAVHIAVTKNILSRGKRRIVSSVLKLAKRDDDVVVSIDRLEMFRNNSKAQSTTKVLMRDLLRGLSESRAMVIGMSRTDDLEPAVRDMFAAEVSLKSPDERARFEIITDCLSRNQSADRLPRIPPRMLELRKQTKALNCGSTSRLIRAGRSRFNNSA